MEFETWASDGDIYATTPPKWPGIDAVKRLQVSALRNFRPQHGLVPFSIRPGQCTQSFDKSAAKAAGFPDDGCIGEEVRRNWASFQYIVSNELYSVAGLARAYGRGLKVDLPADAIAVKADWIRVSDAVNWLRLDEKRVKELFYVATASEGSVVAEFALMSFHFSSKQIKDWVWADFEHHLNPGRCDDTGCHDAYGALIKDVSALTPPNQQYGQCKKSSAVEAIFKNADLNPVWQNYCLKGSQIAFVDAKGQPTILGNSVIERINAGVPILRSSCITCHAYASFDKTGNTSGPPSPDPIGAVDKSKLQEMLTNDFMWGNLSAR